MSRRTAETKYIIFKVHPPANPKTIQVANKSESTNYEDFENELSDEESCFAVYDFEYNLGEGTRNKICFFIWCVFECLV